MCSIEDKFLEIYKQDRTFRVETPETIDPDRTNPNAPWVTSVTAEIGSSSKSIARVLIQSRDMLEAAIFEPALDKARIIKTLHACKESLVACELLSRKIIGHIDRIVHEIQTAGIARDKHGRGLNPFPQVPELEPNCASFLVHANRAIKAICELPYVFLSLERKHSNFHHLLRNLEKVLERESPILLLVRENANTVEHIINLRNYHEHPGDTKTIIRNFHVVPNGAISAPIWKLEGVLQTEDQPINQELISIVSFLQDLAEAMFLYLAQHGVSKRIPFYIEQEAEEKIDPSMPIKYRFSIDIASLQKAPLKDV